MGSEMCIRDRYVGFVPSMLDEAGLRRLFEGCGPVEACSVTPDLMPGGTRGFGYVRMADPASAHAAIQRLHNYQVRRAGRLTGWWRLRSAQVIWGALGRGPSCWRLLGELSTPLMLVHELSALKQLQLINHTYFASRFS